MKKPKIPVFANFSEYDILKALNLICEKPLGRSQLMSELELSEASTRSLMKKLSEARFVRQTTKGILPSRAGKTFAEKIKSLASGPVLINFGAFSVAFKVSGSSGLISQGLEQRDAAIKAGAAGCLALVFKAGKLSLPGCEGIENAYMNVFSGVRENFRLKEGDAVVIAFADTKRAAELGSWAAAQTLFPGKVFKAG